MFKIKYVLSLICLFMLETSVVEASNRASNRNKGRNEAAETEPNTSSRRKCRYSLVSSADRLYGSNSSQEAKDRNEQVESPILSDISRSRHGHNAKPDIRFAGEEILGLNNIKIHHQIDHLKHLFVNEGSLIDPKKTHIQILARLIDPYIDFVERDIRSQDFPGQGSRLSQLEQLRYEANLRQEREAVTYEWWISLNSQLSELITYNQRQQIDIDRTVREFPEPIVMPLIFAINVNESPRTGIFFLRLTHNPISLPHEIEHRPVENSSSSEDINTSERVAKIESFLKGYEERMIFIYGQLMVNYHGTKEDLFKIMDKVTLEELVRNNIDISRELGEISVADFVNFTLKLHFLLLDTESYQVM